MGSTYGEWLRSKREEAGMTQQQLADKALIARSYISHIEAGRRILGKEDARRLDQALNTGDVLSSFLPHGEPVVPNYFEAARQLEQQATVIHEFALSFVPGILQTEAYARAVLGVSVPLLAAEECDRTVFTRLERAKILSDTTTPEVWALLDEAVLRRPIGGPEVMAEQLVHLIRLAEVGRIRIHVMPFGLGMHPLLESMLTLMWFEDQPTAAYSEAVSTGKVHDSPALVEQLQRRYALALSDALPLKESLALLRATAEDYGHHD